MTVVHRKQAPVHELTRAASCSVCAELQWSCRACRKTTFPKIHAGRGGVTKINWWDRSIIIKYKLVLPMLFFFYCFQRNFSFFFIKRAAKRFNPITPLETLPQDIDQIHQKGRILCQAIISTMRWHWFLSLIPASTKNIAVVKARTSTTHGMHSNSRTQIGVWAQRYVGHRANAMWVLTKRDLLRSSTSGSFRHRRFHSS